MPRSPTRTRPAVLLAVLVYAVLTAPGAAVAAPPPPPPQTCASLTGRTVVRSALVKIVSRPFVQRDNGERYHRMRYRGCVLPHGTVRTLGTAGPLLGYGNFLHFSKAAGTFVRVHQGEADVMGEFHEENRDVLDVRTGRRYTFYKLHNDPAKDTLPPPSAMVLTASGQLAAVFGSTTEDAADAGASAYVVPPGRAAVLGFTALGRRRTLDTGAVTDIRPGSLGLRGSVARWTNAGVPKTFDLTTLGSLPAG